MGITIADIHKLTGPQKVSIILLSLPEDSATKLFASMTEDEIREISHVMSHLGLVDPPVIEALACELLSSCNDTSCLGNLPNTEKLLSQILETQDVEVLVNEIRGPQGKDTWEKLGNISDELLALYFKDEHPQTISFLLSRIPADHAAKVLSRLPDNFAFDIITRMLNISEVKPEILDKIEKVIRLKFVNMGDKPQKQDSVEKVAEIFNKFDRTSESKYMSMLETSIPAYATRIRDLMFIFADLVKLDPKGIQLVLKNIDKSKLALALKGASEELREMFMKNMSQRAGKLLLDDIEALGAVRMKDVDLARADILTSVKALMATGEIEIASGGNDELIT